MMVNALTTGRIRRRVPLSTCLELNSGACLETSVSTLSHDWSLGLLSLSPKTVIYK